MITRYKLTPRSSNRKTGPIATTMSSRGTCAPTCPYANGGGCYADGFPLRLHWDRLTRGETGGDWLDLLHALRRAALPAGSLLRHNVAGDLPHDDGRINREQTRNLAEMFAGFKLQAFTYSHHKQTSGNLAIVRETIAAGLFVNLSCDTESQASKRHQEGFPAVCVVPADDSRRAWTDSQGTRFKVCPAQLADGVTCQTCKACTGTRDYVVAFRAHGSRKRKVGERLRDAIVTEC